MFSFFFNKLKENIRCNVPFLVPEDFLWGVNVDDRMFLMDYISSDILEKCFPSADDYEDWLLDTQRMMEGE